MISVLLSLFQLLFIGTFAANEGGNNQRTFGDVRKCIEGNYTACQDHCSKWLPDYKGYDKVQKCYIRKRQDFQDCMKKLGLRVDDDIPCYAETGERRQNKNDVDDQLTFAVKCYNRCVKRTGKNCRKGCTAQAPAGRESERKSKLQECKSDEILDCLEAEDVNTPRPN